MKVTILLLISIFFSLKAGAINFANFQCSASMINVGSYRAVDLPSFDHINSGILDNISQTIATRHLGPKILKQIGWEKLTSEQRIYFSQLAVKEFLSQAIKNVMLRKKAIQVLKESRAVKMMYGESFNSIVESGRIKSPTEKGGFAGKYSHRKSEHKEMLADIFNVGLSKIDDIPNEHFPRYSYLHLDKLGDKKHLYLLIKCVIPFVG